MIVFDASTLILLARTEMLEMFISSYSEDVQIPEAVKKEVLGKDSEEAPQLDAMIKAKKIHVSKVVNRKILKKLIEDFNIDLGEAEAITLAMQKKGAVIATDDRNAIRACKLLKIDFITAISILVRAVEKKLLDKREALLKLDKLKLIGRYKMTIITDARSQIREAG